MAHRILLLCCVGLALIASSSFAEGTPKTFTRAEIRALPPKDMAARVLGGVAAAATSVEELKFYISPVAPTPPWLETVLIKMPSRYDRVFHFCRVDQLWVSFQPVDEADANKHRLGPEDYDPPTEIRQVDVEHLYADSSAGEPTDAACRALPAANYFAAVDNTQAGQGLDAFRLFRQAIKDGGDGLQLSCRKMWREAVCRGSDETLRGTTSFSRVVAITDGPTSSDGVEDRVVALSLERPVGSPGGSVLQLWLTVRFEPGKASLTKAELVVYAPPPII